MFSFFAFWHLFIYADADTVAHHVYRPGSVVLDQIAQEFGSHLLIPVVEDASGDAKPDPLISAAGTLPTSSSTMMLDRKKLGSIVFADPQAMTVGEESNMCVRENCFYQVV